MGFGTITHIIYEDEKRQALLTERSSMVLTFWVRGEVLDKDCDDRRSSLE